MLHDYDQNMSQKTPRHFQIARGRDSNLWVKDHQEGTRFGFG